MSTAALASACASERETATRAPASTSLIDDQAEREAAAARLPSAALAAPPTHEGDEDAPTAAAQPPRPPATIFRDEIARATNGGRPAYLLRQLKPVAHRPRGKFLGWEIQEVWPEDPELAAQCDLRAGDVIVAVNGLSMEFPDDIAKLMKKLETASELRVRRLRNGRLEEKAWNIVDAQP
jgi:type II secretory pathway component PulC